MSSQLPSRNPTAYVGVYPLNPGNIVFRNRDPDNLLDTNNYNPGDTWMNPDNNHIFMLMRDFNLPGGGKQAVWVSITGGGGGGGIQNLQGDYGVVIAPSAGLCTILGTQATRGIFTTGSLPNHMTISCDYATAGIAGVAHTGVCSFNSANFTVVNGFVSAIAAAAGMQTLTTDDGHVVSYDGAGNITVNGTAAQGISTTGNIAGNEIAITAANATAGANVGLTQKGVCSFNSANFTVVNGFVSAIASASGLQTLTTDDGHVVGPTVGGNITVNGTAAQGISTTGNILGNEIAVTAADATNAGGKGVSTYTASQFNVAAGLVSLTGINTTLPCFSAYKNVVSLNVTGNGAVYPYICNVASVNQGGHYSTATGRFTAPVAGNYLFAAGVGCINQTGCSGATLTIVPSVGVSYPFIYQYVGSNGAYGSVVIPLNAGSTVYPTLTITGLAGNTAGVQAGPPGFTFFSGHLIC